MRYANLNIHKEELNFSAGHFTLFSATEREPLHGHNYSVGLAFRVAIGRHGLSFDYRHYKKIGQALCKSLDRHLLLPNQSPYLQLEETENYWHAHFNGQILPFLKEDVIILPLANTTIEELSHWFLHQLLAHQDEMAQHGITRLTVSVYNGPGQSSSASWEKASG